MKKLSKIYLLLLAALFTAGVTSCKKEQFDNSDDAALLATSVEVVSATPVSDAVFAVNVCTRDGRKDSVAFSTLPSSVATYLNANYAGYTVQKSFKVTTAAGTADGYAVIIQFNGKPVGLKFDASGNFVRVFEQRERHDMKGPGWHHGGRFDCRDGQNRDSIAISLLPVAVKTYFTTIYPTDTLLHARTSKDGSLIVISANKGLFASVFTSAGVFVKREALPAHPGKPVSINVTDLPANATAYLAATYPGYVVNKAFVVKVNSAVQGYIVCLDVNGTRYAIQFDANGNFVKTIAIR